MDDTVGCAFSESLVSSLSFFRSSDSRIGNSPTASFMIWKTRRIVVCVSLYSPIIHIPERSTEEFRTWGNTSLTTIKLIYEKKYKRKKTKSWSIMTDCRWGKRWIASRTKANTSNAAASFWSERNSIRTGKICWATSGNFIVALWSVFTKSCRYRPTSSWLSLLVLSISLNNNYYQNVHLKLIKKFTFLRNMTISWTFRDETKSRASWRIFLRTS